MRSSSPKIVAFLSALGATCVTVQSSSHSVSPTTLVLSAAQPTRLLNLRNNDAHPIRFQLSLFEWRDNDRGEMLLAPTKDIVVFPTLLTVAPGQERKIRVGITGAAAALERSYRVIVDELPPHTRPGDPPPSGLTVLTRLSIPLFVQPSSPAARGGIRETTVERGQVSFRVENTGNVHFLVKSIRVRGRDRAGQSLLDRRLDGWYVLAGQSRRHTMPVPPAECARLASLAVDVQIGATTLSEQLSIKSPSCGAAGAP